jgi:hypothetical protein
MADNKQQNKDAESGEPVQLDKEEQQGGQQDQGNQAGGQQQGAERPHKGGQKQ